MANDLEILIRARNLSQEAFDQLKQQVEAAGGEVQKFNTGMGDGAAGAVAFGAAAGVGAGAVELLSKKAAEAYVAVLDLVKGFVAAGSAIADLSLKTGLSTTALQEYAVAGSMVGVSADTIGTSVVRMSKNIEEGGQKVRDAVRDLGLNIAGLQAMKPEEQFRAIASAIQGLETQGQKASAAMAIFGRSTDILKVIKSDFAGAADEAERLGAVMGEETVRSADALGDSTELLSATWDRFKNEIAAAAVEVTGATSVIRLLTEVVGVMNSKTEAGKANLVVWLNLVEFIPLVGGAITNLEQLRDIIATIAGQSLPSVATAAKEASVALIDFQGLERAGLAEAAKQVRELEAAKKAAAREAAAERLRLEKELQKDLLDAEKFKWAESKKENADYLKAWEAGTKKQTADNKAAADLFFTDWKASLDLTTEAWQNLFDLLDAQAEEERKQHEQEMKDLRDKGDVLRSITDLYSAMGGSATSAFGQVLAGAAAGIEAMLAYKQAVFDANDAQKASTIIGTAAGIYKQGSVLGGAATGAMLGFEIGGPIGAGIGAVAGGLLGLFGAAKKAREEMEKLRAEFLQSVGGMEGLKAKAAEAGISLDKLFDAKKPEQLKKAIADIKKGLDSWAEAESKTLAAMQKYGITIDQMGQSFAQLELNKQFGDLYESYKLLTGAGADVALVNERMADDINKYIQDCLRAGVEIPAAMRPILQSLLDQGLLFDAAGNKMTSLDGLTFGESVSAQVQQIVDAVQSLVDALRQALTLGGQLGNMFGNQSTIEPGGPFTDPTPKPTAGGGWFPYQPGGYIRRIGEAGNEAVLNEPQLQGLMGQAVAMALSSLKGDSYQGGAGTVTIPVSVQIDGREVGRTVSKSSRRRQTKVQYGGIRGRS